MKKTNEYYEGINKIIQNEFAWNRNSQTYSLEINLSKGQSNKSIPCTSCSVLLSENSLILAMIRSVINSSDSLAW